MDAQNKRYLVWGIVALIVIAGLVFAFLPKAVPVDLLTVGTQPMVVTIDEEAQTRVHDVFVLSAPVSGRVTRIEAHVGDEVIADKTVLAQIEPGDPTLLDPRSEAQAQAAVRAAESARAVATAEVDEAEAELEFAISERNRANELITDGTISRRAMDDAERGFKRARAALATARASLQMRLFELERARAQLMLPGEANVDHEDCECVPITAPVGGRVLTIANKSERVVDAGEALLEIGDPKKLEIIADLLSADAVRVTPGQRVLVDNWGGEYQLEARVRRVEPFGFTKISALGIEEQRVNVVIDFTSPAKDWERLGHGYQVETHIVLWESGDTLTVPLTALFRDGTKWAVFVESEGRARLRTVTVEQTNGLIASISDGLEAGERVVLHPSDRVLDGARVVDRET